MAVDKNKIIADATKLVQKGAYDKAIATYQRILDEDPREVRVLLKVGELYQKKGDDKSAAEAFKAVAETYADQGFFLKAVAVYKQIVKLDPDDVGVNERLAELYQQLGLMSDAMSQFQLMAAAYEKAGDAGRLTDVLRRMVELDPDNIASSIKLGELYARAGQPRPALEHWRRAADYLKQHNRAEEYLKVAERIVSIQPQDLAFTRELANIYLAKGDTKRALAKLQLCFKADPKDVETLNLLAQAFKDLGQTSKTISVYKELAHVHAENGRTAEAHATWRRVQELTPDDPDAAAALAGAPAAPAFAAAAPAPRAPPPGPPPGAVRAPPPGPPPAVRAAAVPDAQGAGPDAIPKLLTEADVYSKYGLHDKALDHLRKVVGIDPITPEAHEKARELLLLTGHPLEAAQAAAAAVRACLAKGLMEQARDDFARLRQMAPDHPDLPTLAAATGSNEEMEFVSDGVDVPGSAAAEIEIDPSEEQVVLEAAPEPELSDDDALALAAAGQEVYEEVEEEPAPAPAPARRASAPPQDARSGRSGEPAGESSEPARTGRAPPAADRAVDLSDELEEVDFFLQQGLLQEAQEVLQNLLASHPHHPEVQAKLAEIERRTEPDAGAPAASPATPAADEAFDIARELAAEVGSSGDTGIEEDFQYSVDDVFSQFKRGVEQTVKPEDSATHYDLGIAYREMGLVDDAIHEFETALRGNDPRKEVDCLSMIGLCRMAQDDAKGAVETYLRALRSTHLTREAAKAVHFELGAAYEASGDPEAALHFFHKASKADPAFRDVAKRIAALGGGPGRPPAGDATPIRPPARAAPNGPARAPRTTPPSAAPGAKKNIGYL